MKGFENTSYLIAYIFSNLIAVFILWSAWKKQRLSRCLFFLLFAWAGITNWTYATRHPEFYLEYADLSLLNFYRQFILGWFSSHITIAISFIAVCQLLIAVSMLLKGFIFKVGCMGAIVFLLAIAPLGVGSAFPFSIIVSLASYLILRKGSQDYLWMKEKKSFRIETKQSV